MNFKNLLIATIITFLLYSCGFNSNKYYTPTDANAKKTSTSIENLIAGRTIYLNTCGECHNLYKPNRYTANEWAFYVGDMQERSEISDKEKQQVLDYLTAEIVE